MYQYIQYMLFKEQKFLEKGKSCTAVVTTGICYVERYTAGKTSSKRGHALSVPYSKKGQIWNLTSHFRDEDRATEARSLITAIRSQHFHHATPRLKYFPSPLYPLLQDFISLLKTQAIKCSLFKPKSIPQCKLLWGWIIAGQSCNDRTVPHLRLCIQSAVGHILGHVLRGDYIQTWPLCPGQVPVLHISRAV